MTGFIGSSMCVPLCDSSRALRTGRPRTRLMKNPHPRIGLKAICAAIVVAGAVAWVSH